MLQANLPDVVTISDVFAVGFRASISDEPLSSSKSSKAISEHTTSGLSLRSAWPPRFSERRMPRMSTFNHRDSCEISAEQSLMFDSTGVYPPLPVRRIAFAWTLCFNNGS